MGVYFFELEWVTSSARLGEVVDFFHLYTLLLATNCTQQTHFLPHL